MWTDMGCYHSNVLDEDADPIINHFCGNDICESKDIRVINSNIVSTAENVIERHTCEDINVYKVTAIQHIDYAMSTNNQSALDKFTSNILESTDKVICKATDRLNKEYNRIVNMYNECYPNRNKISILPANGYRIKTTLKQQKSIDKNHRLRAKKLLNRSMLKPKTSNAVREISPIGEVSCSRVATLCRKDDKLFGVECKNPSIVEVRNCAVQVIDKPVLSNVKGINTDDDDLDVLYKTAVDENVSSGEERQSTGHNENRRHPESNDNDIMSEQESVIAPLPKDFPNIPDRLKVREAIKAFENSAASNKCTPSKHNKSNRQNNNPLLSTKVTKWDMLSAGKSFFANKSIATTDRNCALYRARLNMKGTNIISSFSKKPLAAVNRPNIQAGMSCDKSSKHKPIKFEQVEHLNKPLSVYTDIAKSTQPRSDKIKGNDVVNDVHTNLSKMEMQEVARQSPYRLVANKVKPVVGPYTKAIMECKENNILDEKHHQHCVNVGDTSATHNKYDKVEKYKDSLDCCKQQQVTSPILPKKQYIFVSNEPSPPKRVLLKRKSENDYGIDDLSSGDSTDNEDCPRKPRPQWACTENLHSTLRQMTSYFDVFKYFPDVDLVEIFGEDGVSPRARTSSANWHSFHRTLLEEQSFDEDL